MSRYGIFLAFEGFAKNFYLFFLCRAWILKYFYKKFLGLNQNSETLNQLRTLIKTRRQTPEAAVGYWKWGITMIGGVAELNAYFF